MSNIVKLIEQKLAEKYPNTNTRCILEIDPITYSSLYRVVYNGQKTHYTFYIDRLQKQMAADQLTEDAMATKFVELVNGVQQITHGSGRLG